MADHPLRPATDRRLGEPLPLQLANQSSADQAAPGPFGSPAFLLRAYAVLAPLSRRYPPLCVSFRRVTHPFATRHQACARAAVRLACVKHAASVQSEPGSNSCVLSQPITITLETRHPHLSVHNLLKINSQAEITITRSTKEAKIYALAAPGSSDFFICAHRCV